MKKTLAFLLALSGITAAEDITFSSTTMQTGFGGMDFSIAEGSWLVDGSHNWDYSTQHYGMLNSVTLTLYPSAYTAENMTTGFGIGIYEKRVSGTGTTWVLVGKTDWLASNTKYYMNVHTFNVLNEVVLSTEKTYTMAFIAGSDYYAKLSPGSTRTSMEGASYWVGGQPPADTRTLAALGILREPLDPTGTVLLYGTDAIGEVVGFTPYASINVTPLTSGEVMPITNIPEPTTATMSLLTLAALASRRRRK
jgi:hypothetical protein